MSDNPMLRVGGPIPVSLGRVVDLYHDTRSLRLMMQKQVDEIEARERELREHVIQNLGRSDERGAVGQRYMARRVIKPSFRFAAPRTDANEQPVPGTVGWGLFTAWVRKNDAFHFLQKRLNETAVKEMLEREGRLPSGVDKIDVPDISVTKIG